MNIDFKTLVGKYALLLAVTYGLETAVNLYGYVETDPLPIDPWLARYIPVLMSIFFNFLVALIVYTDLSKLRVPAPYAMLATILFRPLGVCVFLLYVIIHNKNESQQEPIDGILDR